MANSNFNSFIRNHVDLVHTWDSTGCKFKKASYNGDQLNMSSISNGSKITERIQNKQNLQNYSNIFRNLIIIVGLFNFQPDRSILTETNVYRIQTHLSNPFSTYNQIFFKSTWPIVHFYPCVNMPFEGLH